MLFDKSSLSFTGGGGDDGNNSADGNNEIKQATEEEAENKEGKGNEGKPPPPDGGNGNPPENGQAGAGNEMTEAATCNNGIAWPHGYSIINDLKSSTLPRALSGNIRFDHQGFRTSFNMELTKLTEDGIEGTGKRSLVYSLELSIHRATNKNIVSLLISYLYLQCSFSAHRRLTSKYIFRCFYLRINWQPLRPEKLIQRVNCQSNVYF